MLATSMTCAVRRATQGFARRAMVLLVLLLASASAGADSWAPPQTQVTPSANGQFRVTVVPRPLDGPLAYFEDKVDGTEPAGQRKGEAQVSPIALVEKLDATGAWRRVWQMPLVNDVAPPSVLIADDGSFLVTFDNWHSVGFGDDVVVVYDRQGTLVRQLSLEQILPAVYVPHIPRTVSSRWWGGKHALVEKDQFVELQVARPGTDIESDARYLSLRIRLADGEVMPVGGSEWDHAMAEANRLESKRLAAWEALRNLRASPLSAPMSSDTQAWRDYMFELRERIEGEDEQMVGMVLAAPGENPGYHDADDIASWVEEFSGDGAFSGTALIVASPSSDKLAALLLQPLRAKAAGSMKKAHLVFVGTAAEGVQVIQAARRSGARVTVVDRTSPYPPGRPLPESPHPLWMPWPG